MGAYFNLDCLKYILNIATTSPFMSAIDLCVCVCVVCVCVCVVCVCACVCVCVCGVCVWCVVCACVECVCVWCVVCVCVWCALTLVDSILAVYLSTSGCDGDRCSKKVR